MYETYADVPRKAWLVIAGTYFETTNTVDEMQKAIKETKKVSVLMQNANRTWHRDLLAVPVYLGEVDIFDMENAEVLVDGEAFDAREAERMEEMQKARAEAEAQAESIEEQPIEEVAEEDLPTEE